MQTQETLFSKAPINDLGSIAIRVVVLPQSDEADTTVRASDEPDLLDAEEDPSDAGKSPLASYLESSKGKQCCVFLVNGQKQDSLDSTFIHQELGFKYLRNRMMIIVDVDGLAPHALGALMQGSRQGFYHGAERDAIIKRVKATLKGDPDLLRLEKEAEERVSELQAGDERVRQTLDQLIDAHHDHGSELTSGSGQLLPGEGDGLGLKVLVKEGVVQLAREDHGAPAQYPVLVSRPGAAAIRLLPNEEREITVSCMPASAWKAIAEFQVLAPTDLPELAIVQTKLADRLKLALRFCADPGYDIEQYPIDRDLTVNVRFNGLKETRRLDLKLHIAPETPRPHRTLLEVPTTLRVSSRTPIPIVAGEIDSHVRLIWDGKDHLVSGPSASWHFIATQLSGDAARSLYFSEPTDGRFTLLIGSNEHWAVGDELKFEVAAVGPATQCLTVQFEATVTEKAPAPARPKKEPRSIDQAVQVGATRRPPYQLVYINKDRWKSTECWGRVEWTANDPGCFIEPTDNKPLTLIINQGMAALEEYGKFATKAFKESEVQHRITKYTSHVAFHLYQMYLSLLDRRSAAAMSQSDLDALHSDEIRRVAMTLLQLMRVSR